MAEGRDLAQAWDRGDGITGGIKEVAGEFAKDWREAPGVIDGVKATGRNLRAMGEGLVEQVPNMIAPVAGLVAGGAAGARAGALGAAVGGFAGAAAGNTLVEGGGMVQEAQQKAGINPQDTAASEQFLKAQGDTLLRQAGTKGAIIGAVDALTAGLGGRILNAPARAATERALAAMGVDAADKAAVQAAVKSPDFAARVAGDAAYRAATTGAENVARNVGAAALDPAGEFAGEFVGQGVATGDWDTKNAALEAFSSLGQSGAFYAGQKGYQLATRPAGSRQAAAPTADATAEASLPQQPGAEGTVASSVPGEATAAAPSAPAINPADGPMSKAAALAGDLGLTPVEPAAPAPDVRQELGAVLDRLPPDQQRAARMALADLERADLPAGVLAMRESEAQDLLASAAPAPQPAEDTPGGRVLQTFDPRAGGQPPSRFELESEAAAGRTDGIEFTPDAALTLAKDPAAERINQLALDAELTPGEPLRLNEAHALRHRAAEAGIPVAVVPHPSGRGFDVQPTVRLSPEARTQVPGTAEAGALPYDASPSGRLVAGPDGVRLETRPEALARENVARAQRQMLEAERQRRSELGLSPFTRVTQLGGTEEPAVPRLGFDGRDSSVIDTQVREVPEQRYELDYNLPKNTRTGGGSEIADLFKEMQERPRVQRDAIRFAVVRADEAARLQRAVGLNLDGYRRSVDNHALRHIIKSHGDAAREATRGQLPVTAEDVGLIPEIVRTPDAVQAAGVDPTGNPLIRYRKQVGDVLFYVEEVRRGRQELAAKTMWKTRATPLAAPEGGPAQTSETLGGNLPHQAPILPADRENVQPAVVTGAGGQPFVSRDAATAELQRQQLKASHEVVPAGGDASLGYLLRRKGEVPEPIRHGMQTERDATDSVAPGAAEWRTNALQAASVARSLNLDVRGMSLRRIVAAVDEAEAARAGRLQGGMDLTAGQIDREWSAFAQETGTLGIPRAQMPQVRAEHRGALVNFLQARGIDNWPEEVPANDLKPTQAEFSPAKVRKAMARAGGERSILVSSDGYVVDGHHQWLAHRAAGEPVRVIRLSAPVRQVLDQVAGFPSSQRSAGVGSNTAPTASNAPEIVAVGADVSSAGGQFSVRGAGGQRQDGPPPARPALYEGEKPTAALAESKPSAIESGAKAVQAAPGARQAARARSAPPIDDFGETLLGARKMLYAEAYADGMAKAKELDVEAHPLSKTWPEPDYVRLLESGSAADTVALARALRDAVPTKPQSMWKLRGWSDRVTMFRGLAEDLLSGRNEPAAVRAELNRDSIPRGIADQAALYEAVGHERSLKDIKLDAGRYSMYEGVAYDPPRTIWTVSRAAKASSFGNWPRELAKGDTREAAIEAFKRRSAELLAEQSAPVRGASFEIYSKRAGGAREFFVGKKIGRNVAELKTGFPDVKAARAYLADNQTDLENLLQRYKDVPPVRNSQNAPRIGEDYRKGGDATPEQFQEAFGFRGVQFGNYVEGPRRQQDLNRAYDALMDLAGVLNLPPRALSLGGRLGLAFGARGSGGQNAAAAHYEPTSVVINLTKREGAGSLAHEWWHALDNYFSRQRGDGAGYMTAEERQGQGVREEMRAAFREVRSAINRTSMLERSKKLDDRRTKEYWTTKPEMSARAFESYVVAKLQDQSAGNDYLANIVPAGVFALEGAYPYPTAGEMPQIRGAFDAFFQAVEKREEGDGRVSLYSTGEAATPGRGLSLEEAQQAVQQALAGFRNPPPVDIVAGSTELGVGAPDGVMGVTRVKERRIIVVAGSHRSADAVVETLFHEMFHLGLRNVLPGPDYVQSMLDLAKRDPRVQQYANAWKKDSSDAPQQLQVLREQGYGGSELQAQYEALAVEEGLAVIAEELRAQKQAGTRMGLRVRALANWMAGVADRMGMERLAAGIRRMTYNEAERFVMRAIDRAGDAPLDAAALATPEIERYRTAPAAVESSMGAMTAVQQQVWEKVAGTATVPTLKQRADALRQSFGVRAKQALVDQFAPIQDLSQEAYMLARMSKGADGTMEAAMLYGRPYLRDGVPDVDVKEGGFAKVLADLKGEQDRFLWWVAAQRAERLKAEGKENLMSVDDIGVLKTLNAGSMADGTNRAPVYAKAMADLNSFNEGVLKMALDSGLIDQGAHDLFRDQPYVPFYRLMADGEMQGRRFSSGLVNQKAWQKLKGGTEKLNADLLQNTLLNWSHLYAAAARNRAALATMDAAEKLGVAYPVQEGTKGAVKVMRNGEAQHWAVEDPYLLEAISALNYTASPLMKPLAKMKQILTFGVTVNPTFKIRNLIRDSLSAIAQSELGYNPAANVARGWKLTARDSQTYASMLASGGIIKFGTQENTDRLRDQVAKLGGVVLDQQGWKKLTGQLSTVWNAYSELGDRAENVNRAALYDRLVAKGHSHAEASFMARDLMDFSMSGNHAVVRFLTQSVPFLNARLQGLYKLGRAAHDNPRRFAMVAGAVSLASLGLMAAYSDDDDWKKREDWDRDSYWWFKIGGTAYRIPKPFEVGAIGTLAERTAELMVSDEMTGERFRQRLAHMVSQTFSFDPMPQAFKPLFDIYSNKDSFTGRAIESQADQRLRSQDRYDERTSEVARMLGSWGLPDPARLLKGEWSDLSPKQVDYLLRGYFSWAGVTAVAAADAIARPALDRGERPDMRLKDMFLVGNFAESLPSGGSRYVTQMYEQAKQVEQAYASYRDALKRGDLEKAQEIMRDEAPKLQHRAAFNNASERMTALNQRSKAIMADPSLSGEEKRQRLDSIERQRAELGYRMSALRVAP